MPRETIPWFLVYLLFLVVVFDSFQLALAAPTISEEIFRWGLSCRPLKWLVALLFTILWLHLFEGWFWF